MKEYIKKSKTLDLGIHDRGKGKNGDVKWDPRMRLKTGINPNKSMPGALGDTFLQKRNWANTRYERIHLAEIYTLMWEIWGLLNADKIKQVCFLKR